MTGAGPRVSVVLGTLDRARLLRLAVDSARAELEGTPHEIIVVDGGSTDGTHAWLARQKDVVSIIQHNRGTWKGKPVEKRSWGGFMNLGFRCARAPYVCMISDDCLLVPGAIVSGLRLFDAERAAGRNVGAVAFYWRNWPRQEKYRVGLSLGGRMFVNHGLYLKAALEAVGYADEESFRFYHGDSDLSLKMWHAGYLCVDSPSSFVEHLYHATPFVKPSYDASPGGDWDRFLAKWEGIFYDRATNDVGAWIEKGHVDPHGTAKALRSLSWSAGIAAEEARLALGKLKRRLLAAAPGKPGP